METKNFLGRSPLHFRLISESENRWKYLAAPVGMNGSRFELVCLLGAESVWVAW